MKLDSKYFDKIRVTKKSAQPEKRRVPACEWPGCDKPGPHRAPKGRGFEGQFFNYCLDHVQQYNKTYNFFDGMADDAVAGFQRDAMTGHRPTWKMGDNSRAAHASSTRTAGKSRSARDPFNLFGEADDPNAPPRRPIKNAELKSLQALGLDENATPEKAKAQYKTLVKRLHPDANGGSRENEDALKAVIQAYDYLRSTGFC